MGPRIRKVYPACSPGSVGVSWASNKRMSSSLGPSEDNNSAIETPNAFARRQVTAIVGLAFSLSIWDNIDLETPAVLDKSSRVSPRSSRIFCKVAPTSGGVFDKTFFIKTIAPLKKYD